MLASLPGTPYLKAKFADWRTGVGHTQVAFHLPTSEEMEGTYRTPNSPVERLALRIRGGSLGGGMHHRKEEQVRRATMRVIRHGKS